MTIRELAKGCSAEEKQQLVSEFTEHLVRWFWYGFWAGASVCGIAAGLFLIFVKGFS
jgi:hypothetical protein